MKGKEDYLHIPENTDPLSVPDRSIIGSLLSWHWARWWHDEASMVGRRLLYVMKALQPAACRQVDLSQPD